MSVQARAPRIASLLPSATEIAVALGFEHALVARSHECDFPPSVAALPAITASKLAKGLSSRQIEDEVQAIVSAGLSVYEVDAERLRTLRPDVVLTQAQCAVCAVTPADLEEALCAWSGSQPVLVSLAPDRLGDVWDEIKRVGDVLGAPAAATTLLNELDMRLEAITACVGREGSRPTVAAIEWIEPLMIAGNWVPELIEIAGGRSLLAAPGEHSPWIAWERLAEADPDVIVLMPCGFQIAQTLAELGPLVERPGWRELSAVKAGRVFVADGHHFFNRPGPRLVESARILAECIHPTAFEPTLVGRGWQPLERALTRA